MAFFNLTHLGTQDPFRTASGNVDLPPKRFTGSQEDTGEKEPPQLQNRTQPVPEKSSADDKDNVDSNIADEVVTEQEKTVATPPHTGQMYSSAATASWHKGSHTKYTELLRKHQRNPKGALESYSRYFI